MPSGLIQTKPVESRCPLPHFLAWMLWPFCGPWAGCLWLVRGWPRKVKQVGEGRSWHPTVGAVPLAGGCDGRSSKSGCVGTVEPGAQPPGGTDSRGRHALPAGHLEKAVPPGDTGHVGSPEAASAVVPGAGSRGHRAHLPAWVSQGWASRCRDSAGEWPGALGASPEQP